MEHADRLALSLAGLFILGTTAQWMASRLRLPSILFLLAFGILAGRLADGSARTKCSGQDLLFPIVSLAVAVILFEGALSLKFRDLREIGRVHGQSADGRRAGHLAHDHSPGPLGPPIRLERQPLAGGDSGRDRADGHRSVAAPDPPDRPSGTDLRWEGIVIDPIGAVLAVLVFEASSEIHLGRSRRDVLGSPDDLGADDRRRSWLRD